jgi:predicted ATPase
MIYLRSISFKQEQDERNYFPFTVPAINAMETIKFKSAVTLFVGKNGSGKSTLLEAIAAGFGSISIGSFDIENDPSMAVARTLGEQLKFVENRHPKRGFFLRAEDFFGFTKRIEVSRQELEKLEQEYAKNLSGHGRQLAMG